jgi:CheY-like chemotaxis protein
MDDKIKNKYDELDATYDFDEISFDKLMQRRIINVLLICSNYDSFMLSEDGRINEKIFNEYVSLNLRYPPQFYRASSFDQTFALLEKYEFNLIITMLNIEDIDAFKLANQIKRRYPNKPIVVLTHFSREVSMKLANEDLSSIDYVFSWLGNSSILLAIIKLIEDKMNAMVDIEQIGVQAVLLVEDSIRYYSSYLPIIYKILIEQTNELMEEGLNPHQKTMSMRARPKVLLAKSYEEAVQMYEKYKHNLLGVITDVSYVRNGERDREAGIKFSRHIRKSNKQIPILLQSSDEIDKAIINELRVKFIDKYTKTLLSDLRQYIKENYGFGDFIFMDPETETEIDRANNLHSLQVKMSSVPANSMDYHICSNHFSRWLKARTLFPLAILFREKNRSDFKDVEEVRSYLIETILNYRKSKGRGVIASKFDEYAIFSRIGDGLLGGKARGLAFSDNFIQKHKIMFKHDDVIISIPRTVVLTTDIYDEFMEINDLYKIALSEMNDEEILLRFVYGKLPDRTIEELKLVLHSYTRPLAVRSSSLLEDSHYQPFAGIYSTYMIPNNDKDEMVRLMQLEMAVKSVYASVFYKDSKAYIAATSNVIDEEKMAVVIQEVTGSAYGQRYYPTLSGVARSINFYPIEPEKPTDGVANIALGLGKTIVDGGVSLRFCPKFPKKALQLSTTELALRDTQKEFYALNMEAFSFRPSVNESINFLKLNIENALSDGSLKHVASTLDYQDSVIRDGINYQGRKIITFANILKFNRFPLAEILKTLLEIGQKEMNNHVEIEFAVNLDEDDNLPKTFSFLQIRPIVEESDKNIIKIEDVKNEDTIIVSNSALGNGIISNIYDFIYVKPESFNPSNSQVIADNIEKINEQFLKEGRNYIIAGPGRWGSSDPWLGIPVKWSQISAARVIVEAGLENYRIDPSQGTHFFQNLTSFGVGYLTINPFIKDGFYNTEYLSRQPAFFEDEFLRHVRFEKQIPIKIDGKSNKGVIFCCK